MHTHQMLRTRRIVTGKGPNGKSCVISDGAPPRLHESPIPGGLSNALAWATTAGEPIPPNGGDPTSTVTTYHPAPGDTVMIIAQFAPERAAEGQDVDPDEAAADVLKGLPGLGELIGEGGMHTTDTIDYSILLSGELWLELEDGSETKLEPGDYVIQNGVQHAWHNKSEDYAVLAAVLIGTRRT
jgi:hypothetical protein